MKARDCKILLTIYKQKKSRNDGSELHFARFELKSNQTLRSSCDFFSLQAKVQNLLAFLIW